MPFTPWCWWNERLRGRRRQRGQPPRVCRPWTERLEDRTLLAVFDVLGGTASYRASARVANQVLLAQTGDVIQLLDTSERITLTNAARQAGCVGDGTNVI